ncbi:MAG: PKD domain-containing protein [Bacteroidetes bacterium]|nr:PKD domain-containing protein [Bacteroidota bacterium]
MKIQIFKIQFKIFFLYFITFCFAITPYISLSQINVLSEDFEASSAIPSNWSQITVQGSSSWSINNGGTYDLGANHPASAHGGSKNAYTSSQSTSGNVVKLVSPALDLSGLGNISLEFWEARIKWGVDTDQLKVYYRTSSSSSWVLLSSYTSATTNWVKRTISLPNPSSAYYIAFEGIPKYGYGICIDDVIITAAIAVDVSMTSIEVKDKEFVKARFKNLGANNLTTCKFNFKVNNDTIIHTQNWVGNLATNASGVIQIDTYYFPHGIHSIKCWLSNPNSSGDGDRSNDTIYDNYRIIREFPYAESFENSNLGDWVQSTDDQMNWTRKAGSTISTGTGPSSAKDGTFYMYTEASGNYNKTADLLSPDVDLSPLTNPYLEIWYHMFGTQIGSLSFDIDSLGTWVESIDTVLSGNYGNSWFKKLVLLADYKDMNKIRLHAVTGSGFLSDIAIDDVKIIDIPSVDLGADTIICQGNQINYTVDTGNNYSFIWKVVGYTDTLSTSNSLTIDSSGVYYVIVSAAYGYQATDTVEITVAPLPNANFSWFSTSYCVNENSLSFYDSSLISTGSFSYFWQFDDGDTSSQQNPQHTYTSADSFNVKLTLTSNHNCVDSISHSIILFPSPIAQFTVNDTDQCLRDNLFQFTDNSTVSTGTINSYYWSFGDTNTSMLNKPSHQFLKVDTFTTSLIVTTDKNCKDTFTQQSLTLPMPQAKFNIVDSTQCYSNNNFVFGNLSSINQGLLSYQWNFGDNSQTTTKNPSHSYTSSGIFQISLISNSPYGCFDTASSSLVVFEMPKAIISLDSFDKQCFNSQLFKLSDKSTYTDGYYAARTWKLGDGNSDTSENISFSYSASGSYTAQLIIESNYNCLDTTSISLLVYPSPASSFNVNTTSQCQDSNVFNFTNTSAIISGSIFHVWDFGDGNTISANHPDHSYNSAGTFNVSLISTSNFQCIDSTNMLLTVYPEPKAAFSINEEGQCLTDNQFIFTNLTTISSGSFSNEWHLGDGSTSNLPNPIKSYTSTDSFFVKLNVTSNHNCTDSFSKIAYIKPLPKVGFIIDDTLQCLTENLFKFSDTSLVASGKITPYWQFGDGFISSDSNPDHHYQHSGVYTVKLIAVNDSACTDSISKTVTVLSLPQVNLGSDTNLVDTITFQLDAGFGFVSYFWQDNSTQQTFDILTSSLAIDSHYFSVMVEDTNGCKNSDTIKITIFESISIDDPLKDLHIKIYPNPTRNYLFIENNQVLLEDVELTIINLGGKTVVKKYYPAGHSILKDQINLYGFEKGNYILIVQQKTHIQSHKLFIY